VGYAVEDKEIWLLDADGGRVGFNEIGEIVVRSRYLSPGYWRRPDLTEAKFKTDPHGGEERLCFTGDLGLMLPDGCLMHKGRVDFRVKVRGYGVELAEVERTLLKHTGVREAVVMAGKNKAGESRLVAYFTSSQQSRPTVSDLRSFLQEKLPSYMMPSTFIGLDAMPLTRNGKLDRNTLPAPGNSRPELSTPFMAPRNSTEKSLADIWAEVLCLDQVGIDDNFFDLGGHSLSATRIISRVIESFQLKLSIDALFKSATVADMAAIIVQKHSQKASQEDISRILSELEALSEMEAQQMLDREMQNKH
jgi:acyl carrier protein